MGAQGMRERNKPRTLPGMKRIGPAALTAPLRAQQNIRFLTGLPDRFGMT
jgi:hypothetical protein